MSPFWSSLFDSLKDRGRSTVVFFIALGVFLGVLTLGGLVGESTSPSDFYDYGKVALRCLAFLAALLISLAIRRALGRRKRKAADFSRLSSDELAKARSKLLKDRNPGNL